MVRLGSLTVVLLLAGTGIAADLVPLDIATSGLWVQSVNSIQASPGEMPMELSGVVTQGSFVAYVEGSISVASESITLSLDGTATSFNDPSGDTLTINSNNTFDIAFDVPDSAQSITQIISGWSVDISPGWTVEYADLDCDVAEGAAFRLFVGQEDFFPRVKPLLGGLDDALAIPTGEHVQLTDCRTRLSVRASNGVPGPFSAVATVTFRVARPLALGDVNADGSANLVDVVVLRRQLAGLLVP
jgi:hypothetical protein